VTPEEKATIEDAAIVGDRLDVFRSNWDWYIEDHPLIGHDERRKQIATQIGLLMEELQELL
jgi:hypothetical protein